MPEETTPQTTATLDTIAENQRQILTALTEITTNITALKTAIEATKTAVEQGTTKIGIDATAQDTGVDSNKTYVISPYPPEDEE